MRKNVDKKSGPNVALNIGIGGLTGLLTAMILLLIIAVLTSIGKIPEAFMREVTVLACGLGALIGSFSASKRQRGKAMITGLGSSAVMFLITLSLSALSKSNTLTGQLTPAIFFAILVAGVLGAFLSAAPHKVKR